MSGSGIGTIVGYSGVEEGDVHLIAPNAGDAGVRVSGNLTVAAFRVVNADNFDVGGEVKGVPQKVAPVNLTVDSIARQRNRKAHGGYELCSLTQKSSKLSRIASVEYGSRTIAVTVALHDALHHGDERFLFRLCQVIQRRAMCGPCRRFDLGKQSVARWCQSTEAGAPIIVVDRALNKISRCQPLQGTGRRRPIERDIGRQRGLIGCSAHR